MKLGSLEWFLYFNACSDGPSSYGKELSLAQKRDDATVSFKFMPESKRQTENKHQIFLQLQSGEELAWRFPLIE